MAGYFLICLLMYCFQDALLFPGRSSQGTAIAQRVDTERTETVCFTAADGTPLAGRFCAALSDSAHAPTVLYFYGNASCAAWSIDEVNLLRGLGCNVFVPDFAGYGMSEGTASETGLFGTATAAWDYLQSRTDIDQSKVIAMGWSIGSAVAIDLASRKPVAGLVTVSAFTRLPDVGQSQYPWLPVRLLLKYHFDNLSKLNAIRCPVLLVHGDQDTLVDPIMQRTLAAGLGSRATQVVLHNADHNTVFSVDMPRLRSAMATLIERVNSASAATLPADRP